MKTIIYLFTVSVIILLVSCNETTANDVDSKIESADNIVEVSTDSITEDKNSDEIEGEEEIIIEVTKPAKTVEQLEAEMEMEMEMERLEAFECQYCGEKSCEGDCQ